MIRTILYNIYDQNNIMYDLSNVVSDLNKSNSKVTCEILYLASTWHSMAEKYEVMFKELFCKSVFNPRLNTLTRTSL